MDLLKSQGVEPITGKPYKPTTQGKNERFHQTLHRYLRQQLTATTLEVLQEQIDAFDLYYNTEREHQALEPGMTPQEAWNATPKAPAPAPAPPEPAATVGAERFTGQRSVGRDGNVTVLGTHFKMGKEYIGTIVNIIHDDTEIYFFDNLGSEIISHLIPPKGTPYVGNGKPSGIAADPAAAVRKRKIRPVKTSTTEQQTV